MMEEISTHFWYILCDFCGYHMMEETSTYLKGMHIFYVYSMPVAAGD